MNIVITLLLFLIVTHVGHAEQPIRKPNIVLIVADDMGWKDLGSSGSSYYNTPHLDALSGAGMRFTNAYSAAAVCAPSRAALLTGKTPARLKFTNVFAGPPASDDGLFDITKQIGLGNQNLEAKQRLTLASTETLLPELLKSVGYVTAFYGKWHCGIQEGYRPEQRGYDMAKGYFLVADRLVHKDYLGAERHYLNEESVEFVANMPQAQVGDFLEDLMASDACEFIRENSREPFFLHYSSHLVHTPIVAKKTLLSKYKNKTGLDQSNPEYATMVEALDQTVGSIVETLRELDLIDNTLIIFTSDNGGLTLRNITSNYPLMGGKSFAHQGGYRVPFIAHWPGYIRPGSTNQTRVSGIDVYPTFLEIVGIPIKNAAEIDGMSLLGEMTGSSSLPSRPLFFHFPHYTHATSPHSIVIYQGWKLIRYYNDAEGRFLLFNLNTDPQEQFNLADEEPDILKLLDERLTQYLSSVDAQMPIPADSPEGIKLIEKYDEGKIRGTIRPGSEGSIKNLKTERDRAFEERKVQEDKLTVSIKSLH